MKYFFLILSVIFIILYLPNGALAVNPDFVFGTDTVYDQANNITWTRNANTPGPVACLPGTTKDWYTATGTYINCLNSNSYLGYNDWRVPSFDELRIFPAVGYRYTTLNAAGFYSVQPDIYWTTTANGSGYDAFIWCVSLGAPYSFSIGLPTGGRSYYVWPVRSGPSGALTLSVTKSGTGSGIVTSSPSGISCGATCSTSYNSGTSATLTAIPTTGSTFAGWSGACSGMGICSVTMISVKSVEAAFAVVVNPVNGACSTINGGTFTVAPTSNLCSTGTPSNPTGNSPWYWSCTGSGGGTTATCSALLATVISSSQAKVFISSTVNEAFTIANSGVTVYGGSNREVITINSGVTGVTLDQNIDRINLPGASSDFTFKQMGNQLAVYDSTATTAIVTAPIQGDSDGTQVGFTGGTYDVKFSTGQILLGGAVVNSTSPTMLWPLNATSTTEPTPSATSSAGVFMGKTDFFTIANSGATIYGNTGKGVVTITLNITGITLDQNVERINFPSTSGSYTFKQTGNMINIYDITGTTKIVSTPVQGDNDGTILSFSNGYAYVLMGNGGIMQLGGATVNASSPSVLNSITLTP